MGMAKAQISAVGGSKLKQLRSFRDVLTAAEQERCQEVLEQPRWTFGRKSNPGPAEIPFWYMNLTEDPFFVGDFLAKIRGLTGMDFTINSVVANGQSTGQDGVPHQDGDGKSPSHTFLYYAIPLHAYSEPGKPAREWDPTWGGRSVFLEYNLWTKRPDIVYTDPVVNTAVLFPTDLFHWGEAFTRRTGALRVSIAYKLTLQEG